MAPLVLEGATLGKRHWHYNLLLKDATSNTKVEPAKIDYEKTDIENLFNIDIASQNKDVEYILDVLKGQDMLYVTRAIKRSSWLINDEQFAHIIEPDYLHSQLFPQMMPKASCKLLLQIRLTLKDESRVATFFQYFREKTLKVALKWLPSCPLSVIEDAVEKHAQEISPDLFKRLCKKSSTVLEIFIKAHDGYIANELRAAMILLRSNPEKYLDAINTRTRAVMYGTPDFGKKHTEIVMKKCPHRFIDNFKNFMNHIDLDTFAKYLKKEHVKSFVLSQLENKDNRSWFNQDRISSFMKYMPIEDRKEFMKQLIDRKIESECEDDWGIMKCAMTYSSGGGASNSSMYQWYKHAPFDIAFTELKKMIRTESNPDERNAMLMILVTNARQNLAHIHALLQYYRERHINEPFRFKVQFVNDLLQKTRPHLYNDKMWTILDEIFRSMEVYIESENNVQTCIKAIIVYKVTHDEPVPAIIEQKFIFNSLKSLNRKLNEVQKEKVFNYLFDTFLSKLEQRKISNHTELAEYVELLQQGLNLLKDWKKELTYYPILINKMKDCVKIKKENGWSTSLAPLYDIKKSWKKIMFEDSLLMFPSETVCINALKHDPELLVRHKVEVDALCCIDTVHMERLLSKLRVYWPQTVASEWTSAYRERLDKPGGHKALVRGLCSILNKNLLLEFLKKYEPQETKINWTDTDELELSLRKNIAQSMHIARPQIIPEVVLGYAKGDYVQFTQPSLNAILYNLRPSHSRECVLYLLNGTTSLQKHGIHLAFAKLSTVEIKQIFLDVWKSNKNSSIRAALFQNTHELLCKERNESLITELWQLMQVFIDSLTAEENKTIYNCFGKLSKAHPSIKPAYCTKSYKFLKSLPPKADCKNVLQKLKEEICDIVDQLDADFIADIILEFVDQVLLKRGYQYTDTNDIQILIAYLLGSDNKSIQFQRYEKVFVPILEKSFLSWDNTERDCRYVRRSLNRIMQQLYCDTADFVYKKNKVMPTILYRNILAKLETSLPVTRNYGLFRKLKLAIAFLDILGKNEYDEEDSEMVKIHLAAVPDFGKVVKQYLKADMELYASSVYRPFARALEELMDCFKINRSIQIKLFVNLLEERDCIPMYLLVIKLLDSYYDVKDQNYVKQVHDMIRSHESSEVEIFYFNKFGEDAVP